MSKDYLNKILEDIKDSFLDENGLKNGGFWALYNGIVNRYLISKLKDEQGVNYNKIMAKEMSKTLCDKAKNVMLLSPKYALDFDEKLYKKAIENYLDNCPKELSIQNEDINDILANFERVIKFMSNKNISTKNPDINISKQTYSHNLEDFDEFKKVVSPEFLKRVEASQGEEGKKLLLERYDASASVSAGAEINYYKEIASYWCGFYANIEIAKNKEEGVLV